MNKLKKILLLLIPLTEMLYLEYQTFIQEINILLDNGLL